MVIILSWGTTYLPLQSLSRANFHFLVSTGDQHMSKLSSEEIEFITKCLKENKPLPDTYGYVIPFETKNK